MNNRYFVLIITALLGAPLLASCTHTPPVTAADPAPMSQFIGRYSGNSFETAMGMQIDPNGTFQWSLSVGSLDMRAQGSWVQNAEQIMLTSDPKPVSPRFIWSDFETTTPDGPMLRVVWASNGKPFQYANVTMACADESWVSGQVQTDGWSPDPGECEQPVSLRLREGIYKIRSETFDLTQLGWSKGKTMRFQFERNDLGVADFTGMIGSLDGNVLKFVGGKGLGNSRQQKPDEVSLELRKLQTSPTDTNEPDTQP